MKDRKEQAYVAPSIEVMFIDVEQSIMAGSVEKIGDTLEELDW